MISRPFLNHRRHRSGCLALIAWLVGNAAMAQSTPAPPPDSQARPDCHGHDHMPPPFPPDAMKNREQGMVMLKVLVAIDGTARKVAIDGDGGKASPELAKAASDAAMAWHFHPQMAAGKAVEGWVKVPVLFSLLALPPKSPGAPPPPAPGAMPPPPPPPAPMAAPTSSSS